MRLAPARLLAIAATSVMLPALLVSAPDVARADSGFSELVPRSVGTSYYVSGSGDDAADGRSEGSAFRTLQRAADLTLPGDTVWVMNGTYTRDGKNTDILSITRSGQADNYIQYRAYPDHTPLIKLNFNYAGIQISAAYIVVEGLKVQGYNADIDPAEATRRALLPEAQVDEALYDSDFQGNGIFAFPRDGRTPHHLIIRDNEVYDCPGTGIAANGSDYVRVEDNVVHHNNWYSPWANSGISFYQSRDIDQYTGAKFFVRNNETHSNENKVPFWFSSTDPAQRVITDGNGIIVDDSRGSQTPGSTPYRGGFYIQDNLVHNNGGRGINIYESDNVEIRQNGTYYNARVVSPAIDSELQISAARNVQIFDNIIQARDDRKVYGSYGSENVTFGGNSFLGGNGVDDLPPGV
ncbi:MAG: right-handed parallel beta-helix repeat-containing protein [Dermatophilaceae bacterium]